MGKVKTRILGLEEVEEKQKKEQKEKAAIKKASKKKDVVEDSSSTTKVEAPRDEKKEKKLPKKAVDVKPRGKKYQEAKKAVKSGNFYDVTEAVAILKKMNTAGFDESVELHFVVDEQGLKGEVELPYSTGKKVRVAIVDDKILSNLEKGVIDFDILITHPSFMPKLAKFAKVLGPKGLMPNPKAGTISPKPEEVAKKFEKGTLRWKTEPKFPLVHQMVGKKSFEDKKLIENTTKFIESIGKKHILKAYMKSTMSPSIKLELK